jgi:Spy/CpxP family protein refolding chaperone
MPNMKIPAYAVVVLAAGFALAGSQRVGAAAQVGSSLICDLDQHRDALTDVVESELEGPDALDGQSQDTTTPNQQPPADKTRALKWWMSEEGRAEFGITDAQSRGLENIFQQMLPTLKANKTELDKQEKLLDQLLADSASTEALVTQAIDRVEAARSALSRTRTLMLYRMYRLLTPEQRAKVQAYHERRAQELDGRTARR